MHVDHPFRIDTRGRSAVTGDDDHVHDLLEQVLFTAPGERVNRPDFGSGVLRLVFEPGGAPLAAATELLVAGALQQWLADEIEVDDVTVEHEDATLRVAVRYRARTADETRTAVFEKAV